MPFTLWGDADFAHGAELAAEAGDFFIGEMEVLRKYKIIQKMVRGRQISA